MINSKCLFYGAVVLITFTMTGCYTRREPDASANHSVSTRPSAESSTNESTVDKGVSNETPEVSSEGIAERYATPLPGTVVTDLTVPEGLVTSYDNKRPYSDSPSKGPGGFDDGAGDTALNLERELMSRGRPHDASVRVSDPTIPSAIPTDEVAVNTDYRRPTSYGAYNAGSGRPTFQPSVQPAMPEVSSTNYSDNNSEYDRNRPTNPSVSARTGAKRIYTVMKGDTLYSIARKHQVTVGQIISANDNLDNPDQLFAGQDLQIP